MAWEVDAHPIAPHQSTVVLARCAPDEEEDIDISQPGEFAPWRRSIHSYHVHLDVLDRFVNLGGGPICAQHDRLWLNYGDVDGDGSHATEGI